MITYANEPLFRQDSIPKNLIITDGDSINLTNADIYQESFELRESICSENALVFGSCEASELKFTTSKTDISFVGKELTVSMELDEDTENPFLIGTYIVVEDKLTADRSKREITAYDRMYQINNANVTMWYDGLTFPLTLSAFRSSFFTYLGITEESDTLINDDIVLEKTVMSAKISGADIIRAICELNVVFGHITRSDTFKYVSLSNLSQYSVDPSMYRTVVHEDYVTQTITGLQIRSEAYDIGVEVGTNTNPYVIEGNFLISGKGTDELTPIANTIYDELYTISGYVPMTVDCIGNLCVEVGDRISVTKTDSTSIDTWIMQRTIKGIQSLSDEYISEGTEYRTEEMNGISYDLIKIMGKSNVLERSIEQTRSEITDVAAGLHSEITQTADSLQIQIENIQSQIDGETNYYEREGTPTLLNYPCWDFCTNIPCNNTVQTTNDLRFIYTEQDKRDHQLDLCYDTQNVVSYRFVLENGSWVWKEIADSETTLIMSRISTLEATTETIATSVSQVSTNLSQNYYNKTTTESKISQSATSILSTVSSTYATQNTTTSLQSQINQQAGQISAKVSQTGGNNQSFGWSLTTSKFSLMSGNTEVFKCDSSGVTVKGNIQSNSGTIGGWSISSGGLSKGNVKIQSDGSIVCYNGSNVVWGLANNGNAYFNGNVTIAGYSTSSQIASTYATITSLQAVDGRFNNLNANNITAGTLSVERLNIDGIVQSFIGKAVSMSSCTCRTLLLYDGATFHACYLSGGFVRYY